jgi:hypothetical protein
MKYLLLSSIAAISCLSEAASAGSIRSSFFTNDYIGDGHDRWRSGSFTTFFGFEGDRTGGWAHDFRLRTEIISPWGSDEQPNNSDRPYAGMIGLGAFVNERIGLTEINIGGEVVMMGDQTGLQSFQDGFHELFGFDGYTSDGASHVKIEDSFGAMMSAEAATSYFVGSEGALRPYLSAQFGYETFLRAGVDFIWGNYSFAEQFVRDPVSGFIQPSSSGRASAMEGFSFIAGVDYTAMTDSDLFPEHSDVDLKPGRFRGRLGVQGKIGAASVFYGVTHLTEEFESQVEGQTVGTLSVEFPF